MLSVFNFSQSNLFHLMHHFCFEKKFLIFRQREKKNDFKFKTYALQFSVEKYIHYNFSNKKPNPLQTIYKSTHEELKVTAFDLFKIHNILI